MENFDDETPDGTKNTNKSVMNQTEPLSSDSLPTAQHVNSILANLDTKPQPANQRPTPKPRITRPGIPYSRRNIKPDMVKPASPDLKFIETLTQELKYKIRNTGDPEEIASIMTGILMREFNIDTGATLVSIDGKYKIIDMIALEDGRTTQLSQKFPREEIKEAISTEIGDYFAQAKLVKDITLCATPEIGIDAYIPLIDSNGYVMVIISLDKTDEALDLGDHYGTLVGLKNKWQRIFEEKLNLHNAIRPKLEGLLRDLIGKFYDQIYEVEEYKEYDFGNEPSEVEQTTRMRIRNFSNFLFLLRELLTSDSIPSEMQVKINNIASYSYCLETGNKKISSEEIPILEELSAKIKGKIIRMGEVIKKLLKITPTNQGEQIQLMVQLLYEAVREITREVIEKYRK